MDDDLNGKFKHKRVREYLRKRKAIRNITSVIIFSEAGWRMAGGWLAAAWLLAGV